MSTGGNVFTDDIEDAIFAGVTSCSEIGERTDVAQTRMRKTERRAIPNDVDVRFTGIDIVRILLRTVDFGNDGLSVQEIAALRDNFTDLLTGRYIFGGSDLTASFAPNDVDSNTSIIKRRQGERGHFRPEERIPGRPHPRSATWCTDFKGGFLLGNQHYCYPQTVTDHASGYLLTCEALSSTKENYAFTVFERLFKERGLPANIRSDNGVPFASAHALFNLSKLAVWWLRLGIGIERIKPGHPQQNGRHERMHLTLKKEATKPASGNFLQQQARFDKFIEVFNNERPHEALDMKCPAEVYQPSSRIYQGLPDIDYPLHDRVIVVTRCGRICLGKKKNQLQHGLRRPSRWRQRSARRHLAGEFYGL
jgi:transposase InsO family protein